MQPPAANRPLTTDLTGTAGVSAGGGGRGSAPGARARRRDSGARGLVFGAAGLSVLLVALVVGFLVANAWPALTGIGITTLLGSADWNPDAGTGFDVSPASFGALAPILGSVAVVGLALIIAVPVALALALGLEEVSPTFGRRVLRPAIEVLVGIPSVVFGYLGLTVLVPLLGRWAPAGKDGHGVLAAGLVLSVMIIPTVAALSADGLRTVPTALKEGSLALGATQWQTIRRILLPGARTGIVSGVVLGLARAMGEALAVALVVGAVDVVPDVRHHGFRALLEPFTTMTVTITDGVNRTAENPRGTAARYALALILLATTFVCILVVRSVQRRAEDRA